MAAPLDGRAAVLAAMPRHLRMLSHEVRKLGSGWRVTPEATLVRKDEIATALTSLAALLEAEEGRRKD